MIQLYVTEPIDVPSKAKKGEQYATFDPSQFTGKYKPRVQLEISQNQQAQKQQTDAANLLKAYLNDPNVDQRALTKISLQKGFDLDPDEVTDLLIAAPDQGTPDPSADPMAAMMGAPGAMPGMTPAQGAPTGAIPGMVQPGAPAAPASAAPKSPLAPINYKDLIATGAVDAAAAMLNDAGLPADDIQQQRPAPGQVVGGQVQQPTTTEPLDPMTGLPQSVAAQLPNDITPEELAMIHQAHASEQQGQSPQGMPA